MRKYLFSECGELPPRGGWPDRGPSPGTPSVRQLSLPVVPYADPRHASARAIAVEILEHFLECYASNAVIENGAGEVLVRGHDDVRGLYGRLFAQSPDLHCEIRPPDVIHADRASAA